MAPTQQLKGSRLDLAALFLHRGAVEGSEVFLGLTANEAASGMGRSIGSMFGVMRRMHAERLLLADSDPDPPTRGTQYQLSQRGLEVLEEALAEDVQAGQVVPQSQLLLVNWKKYSKAVRVIGTASVAPLFDWVAQLPDGWLLSVRSDVDSLDLLDLQDRLESASCEVRRLTVDAVLPTGVVVERALARSSR